MWFCVCFGKLLCREMFWSVKLWLVKESSTQVATSMALKEDVSLVEAKAVLSEWAGTLWVMTTVSDQNMKQMFEVCFLCTWTAYGHLTATILHCICFLSLHLKYSILIFGYKQNTSNKEKKQTIHQKNPKPFLNATWECESQCNSVLSTGHGFQSDLHWSRQGEVFPTCRDRASLHS